MTVVTGRLPAGASRGPADFADLATVTSVGFGPDGLLQVVTNPDVDAVTAQAITDRIECANANEETLRQQARTALTNNRNYLAIASPTTAQAVAQVAALTRQMDKLIRFALGDFDGTD